MYSRFTDEMFAYVLQQSSNVPMTQERRVQYEEYQHKHVPRFLFRAWHSKSGGGQQHSINTTQEIVPHGLMGDACPSFYSHSEQELEEIVKAHINMWSRPLTEFSSWAASLHAVLCYGAHMTQVNKDVFISVIDTRQLEGVVVFNTAHLIAEPFMPHRVIEYLAHGRISGRGYKATSLQDMSNAGLQNLFPLGRCEVRVAFHELLKIEAFGFELRKEVFSKRPSIVSSGELSTASRIATLFGELGLPVMTALLCLKPRVWQNFRTDGILTDVQDIEKVLSVVKTLRMIASDTWLQANMVYTLDSPDIDQWIDLLYAIAQYGGQEGPKYTLEGGVDGPQCGTAGVSEKLLTRNAQSRYELRWGR